MRKLFIINVSKRKKFELINNIMRKLKRWNALAVEFQNFRQRFFQWICLFCAFKPCEIHPRFFFIIESKNQFLTDDRWWISNDRLFLKKFNFTIILQLSEFRLPKEIISIHVDFCDQKNRSSWSDYRSLCILSIFSMIDPIIDCDRFLQIIYNRFSRWITG